MCMHGPVRMHAVDEEDSDYAGERRAVAIAAGRAEAGLAEAVRATAAARGQVRGGDDAHRAGRHRGGGAPLHACIVSPMHCELYCVTLLCMHAWPVRRGQAP